MQGLKEIRIKSFMSITDLSKEANVAKKTIVDIEAGRVRPQPKTMRKIADALNVSPGEIAEFAAVVERAVTEQRDDRLTNS